MHKKVCHQGRPFSFGLSKTLLPFEPEEYLFCLFKKQKMALRNKMPLKKPDPYQRIRLCLVR